MNKDKENFYDSQGFWDAQNRPVEPSNNPIALLGSPIYGKFPIRHSKSKLHLWLGWSLIVIALAGFAGMAWMMIGGLWP